MIANMSNEHQKHKSRMEQVTDHKYTLQLQDEVASTKEQITLMQK